MADSSIQSTKESPGLSLNLTLTLNSGGFRLMIETKLIRSLLRSFIMIQTEQDIQSPTGAKMKLTNVSPSGATKTTSNGVTQMRFTTKSKQGKPQPHI